ncbi:hypothetical protein V5O48_013666 [Marasmius crinis-equi]|uniref:Zn(2)-C6 fungal-type domain-containing protein n=1 Tax=Marasmius crinis-equi TaxID=585013 RepID=A0ABR3EZG1_9AGAR
MSSGTGKKLRGPMAPSLVPKGGACSNCRKRKTRCDGKRPACTACRSSLIFSDCEYTSSGVTQSQLLEEQIAFLSARIAELEARPSATPAPVASSSQVTRAESPERIELQQLLVQVFLQHKADLPFFLNADRLMASTTGSGTNCSGALLATIYLWGAHLCSEDFRRHYESRFAVKAQQSVSQGISVFGRPEGDSILHLIQAEVLLAQYLFRNSRHLEGKYHMTKALSLVTGARMHSIRSSSSSSYSLLPPPADAIEEGERIRAFWTVMIQNNSCTSVDGSAPNMIYTNEPGLRVDTPWPEDMDTYVTKGIPYGLTGNCTVQSFLAGYDDGNYSWTALHAKASILFERAAQIGQEHLNNFLTRSSDISRSSTQFLSVGSTIQSLSSQIASHQVQVATPTKQFAFVSMLVDAACIRLHQHFVDKQPQSHKMVVSSARNMVRAVDLLASANGQQEGVIDPIVGPIALAALRILASELRKLAGPDATSIMTELRKLYDGMMALSSCCPLMRIQATEAHQILAALGAQ